MIKKLLITPILLMPLAALAEPCATVRGLVNASGGAYDGSSIGQCVDPSTQLDMETHAAAADPHTVYRLESADVALGTDTSGNYVDDVTGGDGIAVTHTPSEGSDPAVAVDVLTAGGDADSSTTSSDSGMEIVANKLTMLRGCADDYILKWDETADAWGCEADTGSGTSGDQYDIMYRTAAGSGVLSAAKITELTEETAPVAGDFLLCEESGGALRKCDVGDLPAGGGGNVRIVWRITNNISPLAASTTDLACWRTTEAITLSEITASVVTQGTTSGMMTIDVNEGVSSIMATNKLDILYTATVDDGTAALSDTAIASGALLCADIDTVSGGESELGLTIILEGTY